MIINILFGFIIPWIFGFFLYKKDKKLILVLGPYISTFSIIINEFGFYFDLWKIKPFVEQTIASLPFDLGLIVVIKCYLLYFIRKSYNPFLVIIIFSTLITVIEFTFVISGRLIFDNGWNIVWTFFSYLIPNIILYYIYLYLLKTKVLDNKIS